MTVIRGAICLCLLAATLYAGSSFLFDLQLRELKQAISSATDTQIFHTTSPGEDFLTLKLQASSLAKMSSSNAESFFLKGKTSLLLAFSSQDRQKSIEQLCEARESFRQASAKSPRNQNYHIAWADVETQLVRPELLCSDISNGKAVIATDRSNLSPKARLNWAHRLSPYSTKDLYLQALVYLASGDKNQALTIFRELQEISPSLDSAQRQYIYRQVTSEEELQAAIPGKFPEVSYWTSYFSEERPHDFLNWQETFAGATETAISELNTRLREGKISADNYASYVKALNSLSITQTNDKLRKLLDSILARVYASEGDILWAETLRRRIPIARLPALKALILDDKTPKKTMLFGWVADTDSRSATIDSVGNSLGLYLPRGYIPEMLILETRDSATRLEKEHLELLYSQDNLEYFPLVPDGRTKSLHVDGKQRLIIDLQEQEIRYLKVRYSGTSRKPSFSNRISDLLQVYGRKIS